MQTLYEQLDALLTPHFADEKEREEKVLTFGQLAVSRAYLKILDGLEGPDKVKMMHSLNAEEGDQILATAEELGFDVPSLIEAELQDVLAKTVG